MVKPVIPPEEQIIKLNRYLMRNADQLPSPVITVGGQAVMYWYEVYLQAYEKKPDVIYISSVDVDYVTRRESVAIIARVFNVDAHLQKVFNPPSIAVLDLIDKDTGKIKEDEEGIFLNPREREPNVVDIIDRPAGFDVDDFSDKKLLLNTEPYCVLPEYQGDVTSHAKVLVLNPIACIRSRLANATVPMGKDKLTEVARIKALAVPVYNYLLDKFETLEFRESRKYLNYYCDVIWQRSYRRFQALHHIPLYIILESLLTELMSNPEDYNVPSSFIQQELPHRIAWLKSEYERISKSVQP
ncbi:hypothetical protein ACMGGS_06715 [Superficieibacter sp. BNK-5]|uniref:hypothetical protein n=1 Tax=Superficieibacter sp. BNK-5 TaxID=3376142 RepID=UPI0039BF3F32